MRLRSRQSAFTLLELLVALTLMVALTSSLYVCFRVAFKSRDHAEAAMAPARTALQALELMRLDIDSALVPDNVLAGPFEGTPAGQTPAVSANTNLGIQTTPSLGSSSSIGGSKAAAGVGSTASAAAAAAASAASGTLTFYACSATPEDPSLALAQASGQTPPPPSSGSDIRMVTYALVPQPNDTTGTLFMLQRSITNNLLAPQTPAPIQQNLCDNVLSLTFQYFDGTNWWPNWDSTQQDNTLPTAVQVTLQLQPPVVGQPDPANPPQPYQVTRIFMPPCGPSPVGSNTQGSQGVTTL
jgi:prepilin-type N-terminal cleavage/methylation domain-containing protein